MDGKLVSIVNVEHIKMARAGAVIKARLRNILDGGIFEQSFRSGDKYKIVRIDKDPSTYLYADGDLFHFMNSESYEQVALEKAKVVEVKTEHEHKEVEKEVPAPAYDLSDFDAIDVGR